MSRFPPMPCSWHSAAIWQSKTSVPMGSDSARSVFRIGPVLRAWCQHRPLRASAAGRPTPARRPGQPAAGRACRWQRARTRRRRTAGTANLVPAAARRASNPRKASPAASSSRNTLTSTFVSRAIRVIWRRLALPLGRRTGDLGLDLLQPVAEQFVPPVAVVHDRPELARSGAGGAARRGRSRSGWCLAAPGAWAVDAVAASPAPR